jgi:diguanylate cyclase (GGDEF)-like protein
VKQARYAALHDDLTGLPNRHYLLRRLRVALRRGAYSLPSVAVLYLHINGFKSVNSQYGRVVGDCLLTLAAARLVQSARAEDFVSRLDSNEFACLIANVPSRQYLQMLACIISDCMCRPFLVGSAEIRVRASIGIAICPVDGVEPRSLMETAFSELSKARQREFESVHPGSRESELEMAYVAERKNQDP